MISTGVFSIHDNDRMTKLSVISGHASQVFHADFFPRLVKYDVTSQSVIAWKNNTNLAIWGYIAEALSWIGMYIQYLQVPDSIQSYSMFVKLWKWAIASTAIYVPNVLITNDLKPQFMVYLTGRRIRVYASSCEHDGWSPSVFWPSLELTTSPDRLDTMTLSHVSLETHYTKN